MIKLIPFESNHNIENHAEDYIKAALKLTLDYYKVVGEVKPWISYLAKAGDVYVGICSFKGAPKNNKVELAYFTFPPHEGKGCATAMCEKLIEIARDADKDVIISARTLPETNASISVLKKNGFALAGTVTDPEDGEVYEWVLSNETERQVLLS